MAVGFWNKVFGRKGGASPTTPEPPERRPCYIKFEMQSAEGLTQLAAMVETFKADKAVEQGRTDDEWAKLFSQEQLSTFWIPDEEERDQWQRYWFSTPLPKRHSAEMPSPGWHFGSMLETILENSDCDLLGVRALNETEGVLEFEPHAYPYGGTGAMRALVRAFGHRVIGADDGTGYEPGDPMPPKWTPDMQVEA